MSDGVRKDGGHPPWPLIRDEFELRFDRWIFMDHLLLASPPRTVRHRIEEFRSMLAEEPGPVGDEKTFGLLTEVVTEAARYLKIETSDPWKYFALTDSTTMGLGLLYGGVAIGAGQEVLTSKRAFQSTKRALEYRALRDRQAYGAPGSSSSGKGAPSFREIVLYDDPAKVTKEDILDRLEAAVGERTRLLALTWVHSNTGVKLPIPEIGRRVAKWNAGRSDEDRVLLCVDGVHGFGVEAKGFGALHCDFLVTGCHKWLFGPQGTGFVCGRPEAWEQVTPTIPSFLGDGDAPPGRTHTPGGIHTYPYRWALAEAFRWHRRLDTNKVQGRVRELCTRLKRGLRSIEGVDLLTPVSVELSAGIVCFDVEGFEAGEIVTALRRAGILATRSSLDTDQLPEDRRRHVRLAPSILTTFDEIDTTLRAIERI